MQFFQILSAVLAFALFADAFPRPIRKTSLHSSLPSRSLKTRHARTKRPVHAESSVGAASALSSSASAYTIEDFKLSKVEMTSHVTNGTKSQELSCMLQYAFPISAYL
jgi:hypothetical protein